jgi:hypothetical protein
LLAQPGFEIREQRRGQFLPDLSPPLGTLAVDRALDVEQPHASVCLLTPRWPAAHTVFL